MGEIADMMLEGCLCAGCGEYLGRDNGYAEYCYSCTKGMKDMERKRSDLSAQIASEVAIETIRALEKAFGAKFDPAVSNHLRPNIMGLLRSLYVNHGGYITSDSFAKTIKNNVKATQRAIQRQKNPTRDTSHKEEA